MDNDFKLKEILIEGLCFVFGVFLYALCFNIFLNPFNIVVSGFTGLSTVMESLFGWNPSIFIYVTNISVLILGFFALGVKETKRNILGSILYPLMIVITEPIALVLAQYIVPNDFYMVLLITLILYGISSGLIYKSGFTTGGSDIIMQIISKYFKIEESKSMVFANILIIILGMIVFDFTNGIYGLIILLSSTLFIDKFMFNTRSCKLFYIYTKSVSKVKKLIHDELSYGFTAIPSSGYSHRNGQLIMCVIHKNDYYKVKNKILEIDPKAFIIIDNCYQVNGGVQRNNLPFF